MRDRLDLPALSLHSFCKMRNRIGFLVSFITEEGGAHYGNFPHIIFEYSNLCLEDLLGFSPMYDIEFVIDLVLGTAPISIALHRMAPIELKDLKI